MKLINPDLRDRTFLIQFGDIISEFGNEIPWLEKIKHLRYFTNAESFKSDIFRILGLDQMESITSYILTTDDRKNEYLGGLLSFSKSPEVFKDKNNEIIRQQLESEKYAYITCLQIRATLRNKNYGINLFSRSVEEILKEFHKFWGVVSKEELLLYYKYFGIEVVNSPLNKDGLFLMVGTQRSFIKRH